MRITFHSFSMGDVEDPDIFAGEPIWQWQQTEQGRWVVENAHNLTYYRQPDPVIWGHRFLIRGEITDPRKVTEYFLRWGKEQT